MVIQKEMSGSLSWNERIRHQVEAQMDLLCMFISTRYLVKNIVRSQLNYL